jgi:hypothetical protein
MVETPPLDVVISQAGEFPAPVNADIAFSKAPVGHPCDYHTPGTGHRWAQIVLAPCLTYGFRVEHDLSTWDKWVPGDPAHSDVFYVAAGTSAFNSVASLGPVNCSAPGYSESLFPGRVWWWGDNTHKCPFPSGPCDIDGNANPPCVMIDRQVFSVGADDPAQQLYMRVGFNTGYCIRTYGNFQVAVLPLRVDLVDPNPALLSAGAISNDVAQLAAHPVVRDGVAADGVTKVVLRHEVLGPWARAVRTQRPHGVQHR